MLRLTEGTDILKEDRENAHLRQDDVETFEEFDSQLQER